MIPSPLGPACILTSYYVSRRLLLYHTVRPFVMPSVYDCTPHSCLVGQARPLLTNLAATTLLSERGRPNRSPVPLPAAKSEIRRCRRRAKAACRLRTRSPVLIRCRASSVSLACQSSRCTRCTMRGPYRRLLPSFWSQTGHCAGRRALQRARRWRDMVVAVCRSSGPPPRPPQTDRHRPPSLRAVQRRPIQLAAQTRATRC